MTAALLPRLGHRGMFLDGITYASIARNLAEGRGRFWEPYYTATIYPAFHEHPPLAFWLQSLWFRALGDHMFVERAYSAAAAIVVAAAIAFTWRAVSSRGDAWVPVLLWISVPVVSWTIVGNMLETTVCVFVTIAVAAAVRGMTGTPLAAAIAGILSGVAVVCAVLSKGPVGLFPMAAPIALALVGEWRRAALWCLAAQWVTIAACAAALMLSPAARASLARYVDQQVVAALAGRREVSGNPLAILVTLVDGVWLPMAVVAIAIIAAARTSMKTWIKPLLRDRHAAAAFIVIGLAGTLPIAISPKQTGHYLMPAVPFYAIGAAALIAPNADALATAISNRIRVALRAIAALLVIGSIAAIWLPALDRDPALIADLDRMEDVAPRGTTVGICPEANADWMLHAWFQRRFEMSLDAAQPAAHGWFVKSLAQKTNCPPGRCAAVSEPRAIVLMRCESNDIITAPRATR
jgi:4-amino-4-deoxy-L-arabinose transferase-like glycosyltransferase